jgi:polyisoprenoid-binding protein YceI
MLKNSCFTLVALLFSFLVSGQDKYMTKSGRIELNADDGHIKASTRTANVLLDKKSGEVNFVVLIKGFEFSQAGMQEKFNKNVMESETFPSSQFKGTIANNTAIDYAKDGSYTGKVKGVLTIHGISQQIETDYSLKVNKGTITVSSTITVKMSDYKINKPVDEDTVTIKINCVLEEMK